jgi:predicted GTPase
MVERVIIMGAAGRDLHNFNVYFKDNPRYQVVAFTGAQIPNIVGRLIPAELAGPSYPGGIPIYPESDLSELIRKHRVDLVAFSYSDVPHTDLMHKASIAMAEGADFILLAATYTMLKSSKPVISVCAVRTGCGKSQTTRKITRILRDLDRKVVVVRHPMPYGDLKSQIVQRFSSLDDLITHQCTIEEIEEYEPHIQRGVTVYSGIDFSRILRQAEQEADIILWDGGNNDTPFFQPDIHVVLFDPHRPGHELLYYPSEVNMRMAHVAIINKVDTALAENIQEVRRNIEMFAPDADILLAESPVSASDPYMIHGKRVLVVEDGPTLTHGGMSYGAGIIAAQKYGASEIVDPMPYTVGTIREVYRTYPNISRALPAVGYGREQSKDLESTINAVDCDLVIVATPIDLTRLLSINKPTVRITYEYKDHGTPGLEDVLVRRMRELNILTGPY